MRKIPVKVKGFAPRTIVRVASLKSLITYYHADLQFLVQVNTESELFQLKELIFMGCSNVSLLTASLCLFERWTEPAVFSSDVFFEDDVVALTEGVQSAHVLYRENDKHHTVFLTNRCNSNCLMCSQPPTKQDDSWLVDEAYQVAKHINSSPKTIGFSGGEPLLLRGKLREVLNFFIEQHPKSNFELLTNGRLLADQVLASSLLLGLTDKVTWMVPLYGHADFLHDYIVQSHGAFEETIAALLNLHKYKQAIQLRTVLIHPVLNFLPEFCEYIGKNFPFIRELSFMACEPIGFALANRELTNVDLWSWKETLEKSVKILEAYNINVVFMNTPLCVLPEELRKYAHKSISDWKRKFEPECSGCTLKKECSGLFNWYAKDKELMKINAVQGVTYG